LLELTKDYLVNPAYHHKERDDRFSACHHKINKHYVFWEIFVVIRKSYQIILSDPKKIFFQKDM